MNPRLTQRCETTCSAPKEKTPDDVRVSSEGESTDLPFGAERSRRSNTSVPIGRHNVFSHFEVCKLPKTTRAPFRNRPEARGPRRITNFFLNEENESHVQHLYAIVAQDLCSCWIQSYPTKNQEEVKYLQKFVPPSQKLAIVHSDYSL